DRGFIPFNQSCIKQNKDIAKQGPNKEKPFFIVREALPIPAAYTPTEQGRIVGLDEGVFVHAHSPGFEILPNGDALAIYFSTPQGLTESDAECTFIQARLRFGAEEWDLPELFMNTIGGNDQSALLWNDNGKIWFFGGGRNISDYIPFRIVTSEDLGATWTFTVPQIEKPMVDVTAQPICNAFRDPDGNIYIPTDGKEAQSLLWRSEDNGVNWKDLGGRTSTRHSTIVPLDNKGTLLSAAGKNNNINGYNPQNISKDWGVTWEEPTASPFPQLGTAQRPSLIRLASGALLLVGESYCHKHKIPPPSDWKLGNDCYVAISYDNGENWKFKKIPIALPHNLRPPYPSLGYVTVRQGPNGVIHILTTTNFPNLHYEFNEAWLNSDEKDITWTGSSTKRQTYEEYYKDGKLKSRWQAHTVDGRYLLDGKMTDYYSNGQKQHEVTYENGFKTGIESFWEENGVLRWQWERNQKTHKGIWTQYWPNGNKKLKSEWNLQPSPTDLNRPFIGCNAQ
ncbi:MAG: hypothetical protein J6W71_03340, partial [Methanobrevibacter sp.]|nr:hypothetical protein [Methanobrevibacter sp.]